MEEENVNMAAQLAAINRQGIVFMEKKGFADALKIFEAIKRIGGVSLREIPKDAIRHAANIYNNMGACNIRGDLDILEGAGFLFVAREYYRAEEMPPRRHLTGVEDRLKEAKNKL